MKWRPECTNFSLIILTVCKFDIQIYIKWKQWREKMERKIENRKRHDSFFIRMNDLWLISIMHPHEKIKCRKSTNNTMVFILWGTQERVIKVCYYYDDFLGWFI